MIVEELVFSASIVLLVITNCIMYVAMKDEEKKCKHFEELYDKLVEENTKLRKKLDENTRTSDILNVICHKMFEGMPEIKEEKEE